MRWTRVVALQDFKDGEIAVFKMTNDILDAIKKMDEIDLLAMPRLYVLFDPNKW